jgi:PKD repeat protein
MPFKLPIRKQGLIQLIIALFCSQNLSAQTPVASFSPNVSSGCAPLQVSFTNTSAGGASYQWNFGNTNSSTLANPATVYNSPGTYTVTLIVTSAGGLKDTATDFITVVNDPVADFSSVNNGFCAGSNSFQFTNLSANAATYIWDFGDGTTSTATNPSHTYTAPGIYSVKLIATSQYGCQDIETKSSYVTIFPQPSAAFNAPVTSSCSVTTPFNFNSTGANATTWFWNFGDGTTSTVQNPVHQYGAPGLYTVSLIVTSSSGCADTLVKPGYISIGNSLVPSFTLNDSAGCGPVTITFTSTVPNATSWNWNFGDGSASVLPNPTHTYTIPGSYNISLAVTTQSGCNGSITVPGLVTIDGPPVVSFTVASDTGCAPYAAQFSSTSTGAATYAWSFGNNTTGTGANPTAVYTNGGTYNVTLQATSPNGCTASQTVNSVVTVLKPSAVFNGVPRTGCPGTTVQFTHTGSATNIVNWYWSFGDGTTSNLQNPTHTYNAIGNYTVFLIVTNSYGCKDTAYRGAYIKIYSGTVPYTVPDTIRVCQSGDITFLDPTLGSTTWNWNFGNGTTSTLQNPAVTYYTPGYFTVTLTTTMPGGCSQTFNPFAIIHVIPYTPQPVQINTTTSCKPYGIQFSTPTPNINQYFWDFGDGDTSSQQNPIHYFQNAGIYTVTLNMTIGAGCLATAVTTITVGHSNPAIASQSDACTGDIISLSASNTAAFTSFLWNFGNGNTASGTSVQTTYASAGQYTINLYTTDTSGCQDTFPVSININNPIADFSLLPATVCLGNTVQFDNLSQNSSSWNWNFGDGSSDTLFEPSHVYAQTGIYSVTLTATENTCNVSKTVNAAITVVDPQASFTAAPNGQCLPVTVQYTSVAPTGVSWLWLFGDGDTSVLQNPVHIFDTAPAGPVILTVTDMYGCTKSVTQPNISYFAASASADLTAGCNPLTVQFTDLSQQATSWFWDFGDGTTSTLQNPSHTYASDGLFSVTLITVFPGNCRDTVVYPAMITVSTPSADFYTPTQAGCSPSQISFVNQSSDASTYLWNFGDGSTSTNVNPDHIYNIPGVYTVTLTATNATGCVDSLVRPQYITIPGTYTRFNLSSISTCQNSQIVFTDSSINASTWAWDFGDGSLGNQQNPVHTYQDTGTYIITLITSDSLGCTSSYSYPVPLTVHPVPLAAVSAINTQGCSPLTTTFTNNSTGADYYFWQFGNGDTSTAVNPSYTYTSGGQFTATLVATTQYGCGDTIPLSTTIDVSQSPAASFAASDTVLCQPANLTLTSNSGFLIGPSYQWDDDNGNTGTSTSINTSYINAGTYSPQLVVTNSNGCRDTFSFDITVDPTPVAQGASDVLSGCNPLPVQFSNTSSGATFYQWYFGDGDSSSLAAPSHSYLNAAIVTPQLIAFNNFGCSDTHNLPQIDVMQTPLAQFTTDTSWGCIGSVMQFTNQSVSTINPVWQWDFGFTTSTFQNPAIIYPVPGVYDVSLTVTNANGCSNTVTQSAFIEIFDTVAPPETPVYTVTVNDDTSIDIIWENLPLRDFNTYQLFRRNNVTGIYQLIRTIDRNNLPASNTLTVTDTGLDTRNNSYSYRLQTTDLCGYSVPFQNLTIYTSINITATTSGTNLNVQWTPYAGCALQEYNLYRKEEPNGTYQLIATLPPSTLTYIDSSLYCPYVYTYRVEATSLCGRTYVSWSDTSSAQPENPMEGQMVEMTRTTVVNNLQTLTEWMPPVITPDRVSTYLILRSVDNGVPTPYIFLPPMVTLFMDDSVDVNSHSYKYFVIPVNDCDLQGLISREGTSVLLKGNWSDYKTYLQWTPYEKWPGGVQQYIIEKLQDDGTWAPVNSAFGSSTSIILDE